MAKYIDIGTLQVKNGTFLALGRKNKPGYEKYDLSVEIIVKDNTGKVVAHQKDGFINLVDPRKQADELLAKNIITEDAAAQMKVRAEKLPSSVKYNLQIKV
jgi:hypothetical protein